MWEEAPAAFGGNGWENTETTCKVHIKDPQTGSNPGTESIRVSLSVSVIEVSLVNGLETDQPLAPKVYS